MRQELRALNERQAYWQPNVAQIELWKAPAKSPRRAVTPRPNKNSIFFETKVSTKEEPSKFTVYRKVSMLEERGPEPAG